MILECPSCQSRFKVADSAIPPTGRTVRCSKCTHQWHVEKTDATEDTAAPQKIESITMAEEAFDAEAAAAEVRAAMNANRVPVEETPTEETPATFSPEERVADENFLQQLEAVISASDTGMNPRDAKAAPKRSTSAAPVRKKLDPKPFKLAVPAIAALWLVLALITYFPSWQNAPGLGGIYSMFGVKSTDGLVFSNVTMEKERMEGGKTKFILAGSISNHSNATRAVPAVRVSLEDKNGKSIWQHKYPVNTELKAGEVYPFRIGNVETMFASNVNTVKVDMGNTLQLMVR